MGCGTAKTGQGSGKLPCFFFENAAVWHPLRPAEEKGGEAGKKRQTVIEEEGGIKPFFNGCSV